MENRSEEEIKQIALDLYHGKIFTDRHCQSPEEVSSSFLVLAFMEPADVKKLQNDPPGMIFEYLHKAGPRAINGKPGFLSCEMLSPDDTKKVFAIYDKLKEAEKSVIEA